MSEKNKTVYFKRNKYRADEFSVNDLPLSRRQQFFDILKNDWKTLLFLGLIILLASLPYITLNIMYWFIRSNLRAQLLADGGTEEMVFKGLQLTDILYEAICVPATLILVIPFAGAARVMKRLVHGEGVLFKDDFFEGIKMNSLQFLVIIFIYSVLRFLMQFAYIMIYNIPTMSEIIYGVSNGLLYLIFVPILLFMLTQASIYKIKFFLNFKNSYQLAIHSIFVMFIFALIIFGVYFLRYITHPILRGGMDTLIFVLSPLYLLALNLYTMSRFDIFINKDYYPEIYRKGLRPYEVKED